MGLRCDAGLVRAPWWGPRSVELALLVVALAVVGLALFALQVSGAGVAQATSMRTWGGLAGLALVVHLVLRRVARAADPLLLPIVVVLNGLGLVMIERLDAEAASARARQVSMAVPAEPSTRRQVRLPPAPTASGPIGRNSINPWLTLVLPAQAAQPSADVSPLGCGDRATPPQRRRVPSPE